LIKYRITYDVLGEIRMGSPYNGANVILSGEFIPDMSEYTFQDRGIVSSDGFTCFLVQWDMIGNNPGHKVWKIEAKSKEISVSSHIEGCCDDIWFNDSKVITKVWNWDSSTNTESVFERGVEF
jgi:hypothetical protein